MPKAQSFRLGAPRYKHVRNEQGERVEVRYQPVERVVTFSDEKSSFVVQSRECSESLIEFRKQNPNVPVAGAPAEQEMQNILKQFDDEQLAKLGLTRTMEQSDIPLRIQFSSDAAFDLAVQEGLTQAEIEAFPGSGRGDALNIADVRKMVAQTSFPAPTPETSDQQVEVEVEV